MQTVSRIIDSLTGALPVATIQTLAGIGVAIYAYASGDISFQTAMLAVGANTAGAGVLGVARNGSGRGIKK